MEFNSLDAQREACEAYVASQRAEGWLLVPDRYDDGGFSGGTLERPALKRLLADIEAGEVDVVVVYKIDRLSRSLMDFSRLVEVFDRHNVTFVSVTQSFNTTTSMGRLTLNVLLSFAQFEREVIGERIRDKFAASRRKGMWMGGWAPLGYEVKDRKLVVNEEDAKLVRSIFQRFLKTGSATILARQLIQEGVRNKYGKLIDKGMLYKLLNNPVYIGDAVHKGVSYPGEHVAIIDRKIWDKVHAQFKINPRKRAGATRAQTPSLLKGLIFGPTGAAMSPSHTRKNGRLYRYYVSQTILKQGAADCPIGRVPAAEIEKIVIDQVRVLLRSPEIIVQTWRSARNVTQRPDRDRCESSTAGVRTALERIVSSRAGPHRSASGRAGRCRHRRRRDQTSDRRHHFARRRDGRRNSATQAECRMTAAAASSLRNPHQQGRAHRHRSHPRHLPPTRRSEADPDPPGSAPWSPAPRVDIALLKAIVRAHRWREMLESGEYASAADLAKAEKVNASYLSRILRLDPARPGDHRSNRDGTTACHASARRPAQAASGGVGAATFRAFRLAVARPTISPQLFVLRQA